MKRKTFFKMLLFLFITLTIISRTEAQGFAEFIRPMPNGVYNTEIGQSSMDFTFRWCGRLNEHPPWGDDYEFMVVINNSILLHRGKDESATMNLSIGTHVACVELWQQRYPGGNAKALVGRERIYFTIAPPNIITVKNSFDGGKVQVGRDIFSLSEYPSGIPKLGGRCSPDLTTQNVETQYE
jgi:hypothetical protein